MILCKFLESCKWKNIQNASQRKVNLHNSLEVPSRCMWRGGSERLTFLQLLIQK